METHENSTPPDREVELKAGTPVVLDGHTLGIMLPGEQYVQVLQASLLQGAPFELHPGVKAVPMGKDRIRTATEKDFDDFRISSAHHYLGCSKKTTNKC